MTCAELIKVLQQYQEKYGSDVEVLAGNMYDGYNFLQEGDIEFNDFYIQIG